MILEALLVGAVEAWRPAKRQQLADWADSHFYLSAESAAEAGKWHTLPYQREPLNCFTDPDVESIAFLKSARIGYTKMLDVATAYFIACDPCPLMIVQPTIEDAEGYSKEEIAPMLRDVPVLDGLVSDAKTRNGDNTILDKRFPGGSVSLVGANSPRGFRRVSRRVVLFDEVDGYPPSAGSEGDQIKLGIRRTEYYWNRKIAYGSTPTTAGLSRIERLFLAGDQRRYYVPCPDCGGFQVLQFKNLKWPAGKPRDAVFVCIHCGSAIEHRHQRAMVEAGQWRPGPHEQFPNIPCEPFHGHASFHIWAAYSFSPNATWGHLAEEFDTAKGNVEELKTWVNTALGETWQEKGEAPDWERLYDRREDYAHGTCPAGVLFLTCGVDVQRDRLVFEVVGWGKDKASWSIDAGVLPGDTSNLVGQPNAPSPWVRLTEFLTRTYRTDSGAELPIAMLAVDSGDQTQTVYNWARQHPSNRVMATKGSATAKSLVGSPTPVDVKVSGKKIKRGCQMWPVGVDIAKTELYGWLKLRRPTDEEREQGAMYPHGFCHFPEHGADYFKQITAEQLVKTKVRGRTVLAWQPIPGRENHYLDCRVYARAAAAIVGLDRFRQADWESLERAVAKAPAIDAEDAPAAAPQKKQGWIPRRQGRWLNRGDK
jgi:phage terminase large subunit GpA-like protein